MAKKSKRKKPKYPDIHKNEDGEFVSEEEILEEQAREDYDAYLFDKSLENEFDNDERIY